MNPRSDLHQTNLIAPAASEIWLRFKQGDQEAFEHIYRRHIDLLYDYGMTIVPDESVIKDIIQQLFLDLWTHKSNLADVEKLNYYLIKSLRTKLFRFLEENKKFKHNIDQSKLEVISIRQDEIFQNNSSNDSSSEKDNSKRLRSLINGLSPRQREVILLIYFEEKTYEEVSSILSMSIQSVYTLVWRAVSSLRKRFD